MNKKLNQSKMEEIQNLASFAKKMLNQMENGKEYPTFYVVARLEKASNNNSTDQLIGNMKNVISKMAVKQEFITQQEIGQLYDRMAGLGNIQNFRAELGDLLPNDDSLFCSDSS